MTTKEQILDMVEKFGDPDIIKMANEMGGLLSEIRPELRKLVESNQVQEADGGRMRYVKGSNWPR